MTILTALALLTCPTCGTKLGVDDLDRPRVLGCRHRHAFDIAKQGHVNLLGHAAPANADTAEMVAARERFLSAGHYSPISERLGQELTGSRQIVEVGAGTGHYIARVLDAVPEAIGLASDVSPAAARRAARAHARVSSIVADTWAGLPLADGAADAVLCVFAPRNPSEFARICTPGGLLVVVTPNAGHLAQARESLGLLGVEDDKLQRLNRSMEGLFEPVSSERLPWTMDLDATALADLVGMGPNAFHEHEAVTDAMAVDADVQISTFRRPSSLPRQAFRPKLSPPEPGVRS